MKKGLKVFLVVLGCLILIVASYSFGYGAGRIGDYLHPTVGYKVINQDKGKPKEIDFSLFWKVWDVVHQKYVGEINDEKLVEGAINGILEGLGDPYSMILKPEQSSKLLDELSGTFGGIGVELVVRDGNLMVLAPLKDSPAEKAGLKPKDIILKIDDKDATKMTFDEAVAAIRGKPGTKVKLTVMRQGLEQVQEFNIERAEIKDTDVMYETKGDIGIIRIRQFGENTNELVRKHANEIKADKNIKGVIVDLRNNPGGYLDSAVEISSIFIEDGAIVYEEQKNGQKQEYKAKGAAVLGNYPLVVLVNEGSASASEIMAGAIQDYKKGTLVGKKTFGKGSVQELDTVGGGLSLKITIAKWLTPNGTAINGEGIKPDIEVDLTDDDIKADRDPQLDKAIEELNR
ncbi:MAG: S41 family peptidase [Candidatus Berkelbacteria bacterium]|nr:S41 family peptidase [Candidatus Berkelbacteria bacterium]